MLTLTTLASYLTRISTEQARVGTRDPRSESAQRPAKQSDAIATVMHETLVSVTVPQLDFL
jgi:hypothetical protein